MCFSAIDAIDLWLECGSYLEAQCRGPVSDDSPKDERKPRVAMVHGEQV